MTNPLESSAFDPLRESVQTGSVEERIKGYKARATRVGDNSIKESLTFLENQISTDLFVYGLDANTTAKYLDFRVHPKRLEQITQKGWVCDTNDKEPTIVDHNLDPDSMRKDIVPPYEYRGDRYNPNPTVQLKYDYVLAKGAWCFNRV